MISGSCSCCIVLLYRLCCMSSDTWSCICVIERCQCVFIADTPSRVGLVGARTATWLALGPFLLQERLDNSIEDKYASVTRNINVESSKSRDRSTVHGLDIGLTRGPGLQLTIYQT